VRVSQQAWVQADRNGDGRVDFPQSLPNGGGGHLHAEFCTPAGASLSGNRTVHVDLMSHQGFGGEGDKVDIGDTPGGDSMGRADAPSMTCGPKPAKCHGHSSVTANFESGSDQFRLRYLPANLPNGERWFVGGQQGYNGDKTIGAKSWLGDYANAWVLNGADLARTPLSDTVQVQVYTKGDHINHALVHVDARFGADDEGRVVATRAGEFRGTVPLDTTTLTDGWHCLAVRADAGGVGAGRIHTGVIELPIYIDNGRPDNNGTGGCFPNVS
jgi:hypothetical protein